MRVLQQHGADELLEIALLHPGAQGVEQRADLDERLRLTAVQPAVEHAEADAEALRVVAEVALAHLELEVRHRGLQLAAVQAVFGEAPEHGAQLLPRPGQLVLADVADLELDEGLGAAVPEHHADGLAEPGGQHLAREHGLVVPAEHVAEQLHRRHAHAVGYLPGHAAPGEAIALARVLLGGQLVHHALLARADGPLQLRHRDALARGKAAEIFAVEYAEHLVDVHVAVEVDVGVRRGIKAPVEVQEALIRELGDVLRVAAGDKAVGRVRIERAHDGVLLQLVGVGEGAAHLVVDHALAAERAVLRELVVPALLAEDLALFIYQRAEHGVEIDAHEVDEVLAVAAGDGVIGLVREGHGVEEGVHGGLHELHEGLLDPVQLRAAEDGVLEYVKDARVVLGQRREGDAKGAVRLGALYPDELEPGALVAHVVHDRLQLGQRAGAENGKAVFVSS